MNKKTKKPVSKREYFTIYTIESKDLNANHGEHLSTVAKSLGVKVTWYRKYIETSKPGFFTGSGKGFILCTLYVEGSRVDLSKFEKFVMNGIGKYEIVSYVDYQCDEKSDRVFVTGWSH